MELGLQLGQHIRTLRRDAGWSQEVLAEKIGRTAEAISNIERGVSTPTLDSAIDIAKAFGLRVGDLLGPVFDQDISAERHKIIGNILAEAIKLDDDRLGIALRQIQALVPKK